MKKETEKNNKEVKKFDKEDSKKQNLDCLTLLPPKEFIPIEELNKRPAYFYGYVFPAHIHSDEKTSKEDRASLGYRLDLVKFFKSKHEQTNNPIYIIDAFYTAIAAGIYPPMWVLDYVAEVFKRYSKAHGIKTLDSIFGLDIWKGQTPYYKTIIIEDWQNKLCLEVYALNTIFNFSVAKACELVVNTFKQKGYIYSTKHKLKIPTKDTLITIYKNKWKEYYKKYSPNISTLGKTIKLRILEKYKDNYSIENKDKRRIIDLIYLVDKEPYTEAETFLRDKGLL